jgi:muramoyltetrapeptide carboxypeptidase
LFIEETGESYLHIERMLTLLKLSGRLEELAILVVRGMNDISDSGIPWGKNAEETIYY